MTRIKPVILVGGLNTKNWPLSYHFHLKQFIKLDNNQSLLQETIVRGLPFGKPVIVIHEPYAKIAIDQVKELGIKADIIIEPIPKSSGPCAIIATFFAKQKKTSKILLLPVDHHVLKMKKYLSITTNMIDSSSPFSMIGVKPNTTDAGYDYVKAAEIVNEGIYKNNQLITKLSEYKRQQYLADKQYFWNTGIYLIDVEFMLDKTQAFQSLLYNQVLDSLSQAVIVNKCIIPEKTSYNNIIEISVEQITAKYIKEMLLFTTEIA
ncbi:MAG: hypothetical protein EOP33_02660 [Rickettsiaceae bacterium]|nr:MAG: hypothetical protein EOP33_02660 [Rickettsiaceae bacterium]